MAAFLVGPSGREKQMMVGLYDVPVAFYHAVIDQDIHVIPPKGLEEEGCAWQLQRAMHGSRRASLLFQNYVMEVLASIGFVRLMVACPVFLAQVQG